MVVRLRLARFGKRHAPVYNIVVANARTARNSKPIEVIGTYDPIPKLPSDGVGEPFKDIQLDTTRAKYWLGVGAQPSDTVWRLLAMHGLLPPHWRVERQKLLAKQEMPKYERLTVSREGRVWTEKDAAALEEGSWVERKVDIVAETARVEQEHAAWKAAVEEALAAEKAGKETAAGL